MSRVTPFQLGFEIDDSLLAPGQIFRKLDGTLWKVNPNGSQSPLSSGGAGAWGEAATAQFSGSGSPVGVVTPNGEGDLYVDSDTPALWQATGVTNTDWVLVGGGGSQPTNREMLEGHQVAITDAQQASLTWDQKDSGDDLLDLTDPALPVVVTSGTYAVTVTACAFSEMTVGGHIGISLTLDTAGDGALASGGSSPASAADSTPSASVSLTYYIPAGSGIRANVANYDGVQDLNFILVSGVIQRLS